MTAEELEAIRQRLRAATPGPWRWWTSCSYRRLSSDATGKDGDVLRGDIQRHDGQPDVICSEADKALIAHAPEDISALLVEVERLSTEMAARSHALAALIEPADDEEIRAGIRLLKRRFLEWRRPPLDLPPDSLIEEVVIALLNRAAQRKG